MKGNVVLHCYNNHKIRYFASQTFLTRLASEKRWFRHHPFAYGPRQRPTASRLARPGSSPNSETLCCRSAFFMDIFVVYCPFFSEPIIFFLLIMTSPFSSKSVMMIVISFSFFSNACGKAGSLFPLRE